MGRETYYDVGCPFFNRAKDGRIQCEACTVRLPDRETREKCLRDICLNDEGYKNCTFYKILCDYYDRLYSNN